MRKRISMTEKLKLNKPAKDFVLLRFPSIYEENASERFELQVDAALACRPRVVVVDLSEAESISTVMLGSLLKLRSAATELGSEVRLAQVHPLVKRVLNICRLDQLFNVFSTAEDAISADEIVAAV